MEKKIWITDYFTRAIKKEEGTALSAVPSVCRQAKTPCKRQISYLYSF